MKKYNQITKKELYEIYKQNIIGNLKSQLIAHEYTPATMFHSHMGGNIPAKDKHLLIKSSSPMIPDLKSLYEKYGDMPGVAESYRKELIEINDEITKLLEG